MCDYGMSDREVSKEAQHRVINTIGNSEADYPLCHGECHICEEYWDCHCIGCPPDLKNCPNCIYGEGE